MRDKCANIHLDGEKNIHAQHMINTFVLLQLPVSKEDPLYLGVTGIQETVCFLFKGQSVAVEQCATLNNLLHQGSCGDGASI